ncbi:putative bifunctional diguanylate cyclase/phosphodiesterase [Dactylosporangium sp. CS-033363]|uniref:putative bifunctional diguanylate cyclase/phosphodiesterase n=1 Tax=Dactylosporangium sp. CS-033363 TaxID=3239935 RepID=UPI003D90CEA1
MVRTRGVHQASLTAAAAMVAASAAWVVVGIGHVWSQPVIGWLPLPAISLLAAYACWTAGRRADLDQATRRFWRHLSIASVLLSLGTIANAVDATGGAEPSQKVGPFTLAGYLSVLGTVLFALLRLPSWQRSRSDWIRFGIDACVVLITVSAVLWHFMLRDHRAWVGQTGNAGAMLSISLVAFVSVATFVKVAFAGAGRLDRRALRILAGGAAVSAGFGSLTPLLVSRPYLSTSLISVPLAALAIHLAATSQHRAGDRPAEKPRRRRISIVPFLAVAGADGLLLATGTDQPGEVRAMEAVAVALTGLVIVRQIIALRDNQRLLATVDTQLRELHRYQDRLTHQATHDALTDAGNRILFEEHTQRLLAEDRRFRVALLDLDDFKLVNDRLGHHVGDRLITTTSTRLAATVGDHGTVVRLGGDEFALVLHDADDVELLLADVVAAVQEPADLDGTVVTAGVSMGVTDARPGDDPAELLRRADVAMYAAKGSGGRHWQWFDPGMDLAGAEAARLSDDLRTALRDEQLFLLYQPIVELPSGRPAGAEALLRWQHPTRGLVPPDVFIPLAERSGAIDEIGTWVLRRACRQLADWRYTHGENGPRISVNVSARQLADPGFVDTVVGIVRETGADPAGLILEVTETAVLNTEIAADQLRRLKDLGLRVALDDFGTGHSSLSLLLNCPVDVLKVDKSFVSGAAAGSAGAVIVKNLIGFTTDFGIDAVAEGVETAEQAERLHAAGYRLAQGYHFGRPMSAESFEAAFTGSFAGT